MEGSASRRHRHFDVRAACHRHTGGHFTRGRIKDIHLACTATSERTAVNEVFDTRRGDLAIARNYRFALGLFEFWLHKTLDVAGFQIERAKTNTAGLHRKLPLVYGVVVGMPAALWVGHAIKIIGLLAARHKDVWPSTQECRDADLDARLFVLLEFLSA